jgi:hypothetical protein
VSCWRWPSVIDGKNSPILHPFLFHASSHVTLLHLPLWLAPDVCLVFGQWGVIEWNFFRGMESPCTTGLVHSCPCYRQGEDLPRLNCCLRGRRKIHLEQWPSYQSPKPRLYSQLRTRHVEESNQEQKIRPVYARLNQTPQTHELTTMLFVLLQLNLKLILYKVLSW